MEIAYSVHATVMTDAKIQTLDWNHICALVGLLIPATGRHGNLARYSCRERSLESLE